MQQVSSHEEVAEAASRLIDEVNYWGAITCLQGHLEQSATKPLSLFLLLSKAQQKAKLIEDAYATLARASETDGEEPALLSAVAELDMATENWTKAIASWRHVLKYPECGGGAKAYGQLAKCYANIGEPEQADLCRQQAQACPDYPELAFQEKLERFLQDKRWQKALALIDGNSDYANTPEIQQARKQCAVEVASSIVNHSLRKLVAGQGKQAREYFDHALSVASIAASKAAWGDAFETLTGFYQQTDADGVSTYSFPARGEPLRKVLVGGNGWSGSSALHDFFREFEQTKPIVGEFRHIQMPMGFRSLRNLENQSNRALSFLSAVCLGLREHSSGAEFNLMQSGRRFLLRDRPDYAVAVNEVLRAYYRHGLAEDQNSLAQLYRQTARLIDTMVSLDDKPEQARLYSYLLDNVVFCANIETLNFIDNFAYFAVFRDPRSQFVARMHEDRVFHRDVDQFIAKYRKHRVRFATEKKHVGPSKGQIFEVSFEEFVLSAAYRSSLVRAAGLEGRKHNALSFFNPALSKQNIRLHETYEDQAAIRRIEAELPEFLWRR